MLAIITNKFRLHNAPNFVESFSETSPNIYYLAIAAFQHLLHQQVATVEHNTKAQMHAPLTPTDSVSDEFYFFDDIIAANELLHQMYLE